jgi:hypothetical protein
MRADRLAPRTFVLVHGGFHGPWCWDRLRPELEAFGHRTVAPSLPVDDPAATLDDYVAAVADSIDGVDPPGAITIVAHSMAGCVAPVVPAARDIDEIVFLSSVLPTWFRPMEPPTDLSAMSMIDADTTTSRDAAGRSVITADGARRHFYADCDAEDAEAAIARLRPQGLRWYPEAPTSPPPTTRYAWILCIDDRCIHPHWQQWAARQRVGVEPIELPGGHSPFLARPAALAEALHATVPVGA